MNKKTLWITRTAIFLALLVAGQYLTKPAGQLITGSAVNFVLITAALTAGVYSAGTVAVLSPIFAAMAGIAPNWALVPYIALGNLVLVVLVYLIASQKYKGAALRMTMSAVGVVVGAAAKCGILMFGVATFVAPTMPEAGAANMLKIFAFTSQMPTALIGGAIAVIIAPVIKKAVLR